jgi:hypothetical protein
MKHLTKILTAALAILLVAVAMATAAYANCTITLTPSSEVLREGDTFTLTVSIAELTASSLGISIACDDSLQITDGQWLKNGLIASFDPAKNKAVFTPGGAANLSGDVFVITLRVKEFTGTAPTVTVTVIGKNGTKTVLEETATQTVTLLRPDTTAPETEPETTVPETIPETDAPETEPEILAPETDPETDVLETEPETDTPETTDSENPATGNRTKLIAGLLMVACIIPLAALLFRKRPKGPAEIS